MATKEKNVQTLQNRVRELERQLAEAQAAIVAFTELEEDKVQKKDGRYFEQHFYKLEQKWKEEKAILLANEERIQSMLLVAPHPLMIQREDGKVLMINAAWTEVTGYTLEDIPTIEEWTRKAYGKRAPERRTLIYNEGFSQEGMKDWGEFEVTIRSGEKRILDFSSAPLGVDSKRRRLAMTMAVDVTDRKRMEQTLIENEQHLRQLNADLEQRNIEVEVERRRWQGVVEGIADEVWVCDAQGKMSLINLSTITAMGLAEFRDKSVDEVLQEVEILHPNGQLRSPEQAPLLRSLLGEIVRGEEIMRHRRTGKMRYRQYSSAPTKDAQGRITGAVAIVRDITEFKQAQERIAYQAWLLANVNDAIVGSDAQFRLTAWNATAESMYGWKAEEVLGWNGVELLQTQWPQEDANEMRRIIAESGRWRGEATQLRKDGTRIPVEVSSMVLRDESGQITGYVSVNRDITERKQAEEALRERERRLKRSNQELQDFAFTASHELQEPLRKIETFGELLQERAPQLDDQGREYIERMRSAAGRMRNMVDGLLQLSRVTTQGKPFVQVDLSQIIIEVLSDLEDQIQRTNGKVDVETLSAIEGDPLQLRQLMQNLIGNALKYHDPDRPPEVKVYAKQTPGRVQIFVEDKGIGFEQEEAEHIFQPFVRLIGRSQYEGSGMGLAICRRIVERHGGEITAHSQPGQGAMFIVTLPIHHAESVSNELRKDASNEDPGATPGRGG